MTTSTSTPTLSRAKFRRGSALAAIACTVAVSAGSAVLGAAPAQALGLNTGCQVQIAKVDGATGLPLAGASFKVATADGSAKILTTAQVAQINAQFAQLVAPFAAFNAAFNAEGPLSPTAFPFLRDVGGAVPSTTIADVKASLAILTPFANAPTIPSSATAGFDTSAGVAFQTAIRAQVAAEKAFLAANGQVQDLGPTGGLGPAPVTNPSPTGAPTITNPTGTGARNPQNAIEVGATFTLNLTTRPGGMLTLPAGVDFVSATNGAIFDPVTRTITNPAGGMAVLTLRGTQPGSVTLQASDMSLPGGPVPAGTFHSGTLTLAFQTPVSAIAPPPAAMAFTRAPSGLVSADPALLAFGDRTFQIVAQVNLPAPLAAQLAAFKQAVEVASLTEPTSATGTLAVTPIAAVGAATDPAAIVVDSGPALGTSADGVVPVVITEATAPAGFALDTSAGQNIPVGFSACLAPATPPAPGSPAWVITTGTTPDGRGTLTTATLRDVAAAVAVPPVVVPPVTTPPVVPPVVVPPVVTPPVTTPPVVPPVATTPPVVPPVTTPPVIPPVVTTPPVVIPPVAVVPPVVTTPPVAPAPVVVPVIPAPVVTPAPAPVAIAVPVAPAPVTPAPQVARVAPPRGVDAGLAPAADRSSGTGQRVLGGILGLTGLTAAGGMLARRRRQG